MVSEPRENKSMAWMVTMQMEDKIAAEHLEARYILGTLSKTAEDGEGNVGKTIRLITRHKKRT